MDIVVSCNNDVMIGYHEPLLKYDEDEALNTV